MGLDQIRDSDIESLKGCVTWVMQSTDYGATRPPCERRVLRLSASKAAVVEPQIASEEEIGHQIGQSYPRHGDPIGRLVGGRD